MSAIVFFPEADLAIAARDRIAKNVPVT